MFLLVFSLLFSLKNLLTELLYTFVVCKYVCMLICRIVISIAFVLVIFRLLDDYQFSFRHKSKGTCFLFIFFIYFSFVFFLNFFVLSLLSFSGCTKEFYKCEFLISFNHIMVSPEACTYILTKSQSKEEETKNTKDKARRKKTDEFFKQSFYFGWTTKKTQLSQDSQLVMSNRQKNNLLAHQKTNAKDVKC